MIERLLKSRRPRAEEQLKRRIHAAEARVVRVGHHNQVFRDLYASLLLMSWMPLMAIIGLFYLVINLAFASFYYLDLQGIDQARNFGDAFFFSVQTMATIGYGRMAPVGLPANILSTIEAFTGFIYYAFTTGLIFAKFSRPTAQVLFTRVAVISDFEGKPHLKIRLANQRSNSIVDVSARLFLLRSMVTKEGFPMRRFIDLKIVRNHMPILRLTWTIFHPIDEDSPFYGMTGKEIEDSDDELFVTLIGLDETLSQTIHARYSYLPEEIVHGAFFEDVLRREDHTIQVNYRAFHSVRYEPPAKEQMRKL